MRKPKLPFHVGRRQFSVAHLVVALVAMFIVLPFAEAMIWGGTVEAIAFSVVLLAAVSAVGGRKSTLFAAIALVVPALATRWLSHLWPSAVPIEISLCAGFIFVMFVIWHLFRYVMAAPSVNEEVLCAAVSVYLLFAVAWAFLYHLLAFSQADAFAFNTPAATGNEMVGFTALYFSLVSLTTIGFGDILPVSNLARMLVLLEAVTGMFYMTLMIARLVGLYSSKKNG